MGVGGGGVTLPTVNEPFIVPECGSQTYLYVPSVKVTVQVTLPVSPISVARFTPGPERWKLCSSDTSSTSMTYAPGSSFDTRAPEASRRLIVKPGPTVAKSCDALLRRGRTAYGTDE